MGRRTYVFMFFVCAFFFVSTTFASFVFAADDDGGIEIFDKKLKVGSSFMTSTSVSTSSVGTSVSMATDYSELDRRRLLRERLEHDRVAVAEALGLGAGEVLADLAYIFSIAPQHQVAFAKLLRAHRGQLLAIFMDAPKVDQAKADRFFELVRIAVMEARLS